MSQLQGAAVHCSSAAVHCSSAAAVHCSSAAVGGKLHFVQSAFNFVFYETLLHFLKMSFSNFFCPPGRATFFFISIEYSLGRWERWYCPVASCSVIQLQKHIEVVLKYDASTIKFNVDEFL